MISAPGRCDFGTCERHGSRWKIFKFAGTLSASIMGLKSDTHRERAGFVQQLFSISFLSIYVMRILITRKILILNSCLNAGHELLTALAVANVVTRGQRIKWAPILKTRDTFWSKFSSPPVFFLDFTTEPHSLTSMPVGYHMCVDFCPILMFVECGPREILHTRYTSTSRHNQIVRKL